MGKKYIGKILQRLHTLNIQDYASSPNTIITPILYKVKYLYIT